MLNQCDTLTEKLGGVETSQRERRNASVGTALLLQPLLLQSIKQSMNQNCIDLKVQSFSTYVLCKCQDFAIGRQKKNNTKFEAKLHKTNLHVRVQVAKRTTFLSEDAVAMSVHQNYLSVQTSALFDWKRCLIWQQVSEVFVHPRVLPPSLECACCAPYLPEEGNFVTQVSKSQ